MDAYDAGGLTFEIASLFVGPAAEMITVPKQEFSQMSKNGVQRLTVFLRMAMMLSSVSPKIY